MSAPSACGQVSGWTSCVLAMAVTGYRQLEEALEAAFPERFAGPIGSYDLPSHFVWAMLDGAVLRAALGRLELELRPDDLAASVREMVDLVQRDRDRSIAARVVTDITVEAPFHAGSVELRPVVRPPAQSDSGARSSPGLGAMAEWN